jgi:ribosomal protein L36
MSENLIQFGEMKARFLKADDIIERHSRIYVVTDTPIVWSFSRHGHIVIVCKNEEGGSEALSVHAEIMVPLFNEVNDAEWSAATGEQA